MELEVLPQKPNAHCYICYSQEIDMVCHHCGRAMCKEDYKDSIEDLGSRDSLKYEFANLGLETVLQGNSAVHCRGCVEEHHLRLRWFWMPRILTLGGLLGAIFAIVLAVYKMFIISLLSLFAVSLVIFVLGTLTWIFMSILLRFRNQYVNRPPLPVIPDIRRIDIEEEITGEIKLENDGTYTSEMKLRYDISSEMKLLDGKLSFQLGLKSSDRDRLRRYLKKYRAWYLRLPIINGPLSYLHHEFKTIESASPIYRFLEYTLGQRYNWKTGVGLPFHGGFAVLEGTPNLLVNSDISYNSDDASGASIDGFDQINTLVLSDQIDRNSYLGGMMSRRNSQWDKHLSYSVELDEKSDHLPVQLIPSFPQDGARYTLELTIQIPADEKRFDVSKSINIKRLLLCVPNSFGPINKDRPNATIASRGSMQEILWENYALSKDVTEALHQELLVSYDNDVSKSVLHREFMVSFKDEINPSETLQGEIELRIPSSFSKIEKLAFFYPWGEKRKSLAKSSQKTILANQEIIINVEFELHLSGLCFQKQDAHKFRHTQKGVIPDYRIINILTQKITSADFYIKSIVENQPRTSKKGSNITNRSWDVVGRYYENLYPLDFHLTITGEEVEDKPDLSNVQVDGTVQGDVDDSERADNLEETSRRLSGIIKDSLNRSS